MTRASLLHILDHATGISEAEVRELEQLAAAFPYCQTAHLLLAKAAHDRGNMLAGQRLRRAATYATDRELLRRLIEQPAPPAASGAFTAAAAPLAAKDSAPSIVGEPVEPEPTAAPAAVEAPHQLAAGEQVPPADSAAAVATDSAAGSEETLAAEQLTAVDPTTEPAAQATEDVLALAETKIEAAQVETVTDIEAQVAAPPAEAPEMEAEAAAAGAPEVERPSASADGTAEPQPAAINAAAGSNAEPLPAAEPAVATAGTESVVAESAAKPEEAESAVVEPAAQGAAAPATDAAVEAPTETSTATAATEAAAAGLTTAAEAGAGVAVGLLASAPGLLPGSPDELPPAAPPIRPPVEAGSSRFEFGLGEAPVPEPAYQLPELPEEEEAPIATIPPFRADELLAYALSSGSRLGSALTLRDAELTTDQPVAAAWQPDAAALAHLAANRPVPPPAPSSLVLIDRFLRSQPRIKSAAARPAPPDVPQADLSVRSTSAAPSLASESLAKIMVKQGKIGRAIEIYEQLMQRQPEKKAYFAAQIDLLNQQPE